jgi:ketosteroid isomerase-like protein
MVFKWRIIFKFSLKSVLFLSLLTVSLVMAQEPDSSSALFQMREAERNFARASIMYGRNAAFVENFADESVIFTNTWLTNGKQFWKDHAVAPVVLKWEPEFMDIADSRDFGISTGPWEVQEYRPYSSPVATGYFLSVWKKQPGGAWQVILDAGSSTPMLTAYDHAFSFPAGADKAVPDPKKMNVSSIRSELLDREKQMLSAWKKNPLPDTYASFFAPSVRLQRNGYFPAAEMDTIYSRVAQLQKTLTWTSAGSGAAGSGDLGFTYGVLEIPADAKTAKGHYVRIWRKQPDGRWAIILEMMNMD